MATAAKNGVDAVAYLAARAGPSSRPRPRPAPRLTAITGSVPGGSVIQLHWVEPVPSRLHQSGPFQPWLSRAQECGIQVPRSGLKVRAERDPGSYPKGTKVSDAELAAVPREAHPFHGEWNYTINGTRLASRRRKRVTPK